MNKVENFTSQRLQRVNYNLKVKGFLLQYLWTSETINYLSFVNFSNIRDSTNSQGCEKQTKNAHLNNFINKS
ncbi:CLUMA_CG005885, isoform A [Clunio marinus]|uniref:CLUMA_CG005885, isoform A n=1 Tax=Clunio marinus TaxID=568069 RepID=A0A1J1I1S1_9DIPT|nr:CLUMA_CG005885, isoform A [Clunio marinus]